MADQPYPDGPVVPHRVLEEVESEIEQADDAVARARVAYDDSALSRLDTDSARYDDPRQNPIAFLPATTWDTGDVIDPRAPDPTPVEIQDPRHPDYVEPWTPG